jgi:hypothetical protein
MPEIHHTFFQDEEDEQLFMHTQPLVRNGVVATLALLKVCSLLLLILLCCTHVHPQTTGDLNKTESLAGRARDSRTVDPSEKLSGLVTLSKLSAPCSAAWLQV